MASESSSNPPSIASTADAVDRQIKVFELPANAAAPVEMPESFYKLDSSELKKLYQSQMEQRQKLENSPLKTQKMRNAEEQERMKKYPKTTMRIRFPDRRILQATFLSKEPGKYSILRQNL
ncbi:uncharacterized protein BYT42DRAFT_491752 [Radiomyces spectabilis]|uniref:uncharacterized protein n=1 Tax=Radiomyces spectabilis TaxID=64574 RepID=UPI0022207EF5|nr:uncharacterized protein BYT42DRAFT_491752 [Radiomyces spectabilis]KAI8388702.1 hypothetical protein BYT42DRAFT_491752 [Radiomyces spectabilis]